MCVFTLYVVFAYPIVVLMCVIMCVMCNMCINVRQKEEEVTTGVFWRRRNKARKVTRSEEVLDKLLQLGDAHSWMGE